MLIIDSNFIEIYSWVCNQHLTCRIDLNIVKDVFTSHPILDFVQQKRTKLTMELIYMLPILYCQYYACWCPGDFRSQGTSRHGIDQISWNIPTLASRVDDELSPSLVWITTWCRKINDPLFKQAISYFNGVYICHSGSVKRMHHHREMV